MIYLSQGVKEAGFMAGKTTHTKVGKTKTLNPFESLTETITQPFTDLGKGILHTAQDELKISSLLAVDQILSTEHKIEVREHKDLAKEGEIFNAGKKIETAPKAKRIDAAPAMEYFSQFSNKDIIHSGERLQSREAREMEQTIQNIKAELLHLVSSSNVVLQAEFAQVAVEQAPVNPGKYHLGFFEWILELIKQTRMKVEDSGAWIAAVSSKKGKKGYWNMFKKHGTSFGLSNERTVATQTG